MFELRKGQELIASSATPFVFDENRRVWRGERLVYDFERELVQAWTGAEPYGGEFQTSSAGPTIYPKVSPVEFKLLFTSAERLEIKRHRLGDEAATPALAPDAIIGDWFDIIDDPRLTTVDLALQSTQDGLAYLVSKGIITEARMAEILTGEVR